MKLLPAFRRKAALNLYKNPTLTLCKMTFTSDFVSMKSGDMYPIIEKRGDCVEKVLQNGYSVSGQGCVLRLLGGFFPYATYEMTVHCGRAGFAFTYGDFSVLLDTASSTLIFDRLGKGKNISLNGRAGENMRLIVSFCGGTAFAYTACANEKPEFAASFEIDGSFLRADVFSRISAATKVYGGARISGVSSYLDAGICQADIRPVRFEDGSVIIENGRMFFTVSSRMGTKNYQSVLSLKKDSCEFNLEGAILFDYGDGVLNGDVATSLIFDRNKKEWLFWTCAFSQGHILACGRTENDPRFGVNVLEAEVMGPIGENPDTDFLGKTGDEDPDFVFDKEKNKWYLTVCRLDSDTDNKAYRYFLFESDDPLSGYKFVRKTLSGCETGGSIVKGDGGYYFVCGSDFDKKSCYHVYDLNDFSRFDTLKCDYPDGGFRGWGSVFKVPGGTREKYMWITFDRFLGDPEYNWSYGNIYLYES